MTPTHPDVVVQLDGLEDNPFGLIPRVGRALRAAGHPDAAGAFTRDAMAEIRYDRLLQLCQRTVTLR